MFNKYIIAMAIRAAITGAIAGGAYAVFGWIGVAGLALIELNEISDKLGDIRERLPLADASSAAVIKP